MDLYTENDLKEMQTKHDNLKATIYELQTAIDKLQNSHDNYKALRVFYGSDQWLKLHRNSKLENRAAILSEDQLFDLISEHNDCLGQLLELTTKMYKET